MPYSPSATDLESKKTKSVETISRNPIKKFCKPKRKESIKSLSDSSLSSEIQQYQIEDEHDQLRMLDIMTQLQIIMEEDEGESLSSVSGSLSSSRDK